MGDIKINRVNSYLLDRIKTRGGETRKITDKSFKDLIKEAIYKVGNMEREADKKIIEMLKGKASVHETMIALQKAEISMRVLLSIRNKLLEAYKEIMHMQFQLRK